MRVVSDANMDDFIREVQQMLNNGIRNEKVREVTLSITGETGVDTDELAVYRYIKNRFRYVPDPYKRELVIAPHIMLNQMEENGITHGDCDDVSVLAASMYGSVGKPCKVVLVDEYFDGEINHAIACVKDKNGKWIDVDLSGNVPLGWVSDYKARLDIEP